MAMLRTSAVWVALLAFSAAGLAQAPKERKNIDKLTPQELAAYKHAIDVLQKSTDPNNNYVYHANLHNLFLTTPPHGCEHGNDLFFPWHRRHLANFEKALQESDPTHATLSTKDVTIPYWNWTQPASGNRYPKNLENELDAGDVRNPLYDDFRNTDASAPIYDEVYMTGIVRTNSDWNQFAGGPKDVNEHFGAFEQPSHNTMHSSYIGGDMGDPGSAAMDPIYWSFHAFIDMQWDRWQKIHNKPPTSLDKVLRGFKGAPTVNGTIDVAKLGYFYTHTPESIVPPVVAAHKLDPRVLRLATSIPGAERSVAVWGGEGPFSFKVTVPGDFHRADVWFDDIRIPESFSYRAEVFIHPVDQKYQPADSAGFITVWKGHTALDGKKTPYYWEHVPHSHRQVAEGHGSQSREGTDDDDGGNAHTPSCTSKGGSQARDASSRGRDSIQRRATDPRWRRAVESSR
jgi:Common central domain of tyrosinase